MKRNICIHGHFYQPPRENPWLEDVEIEDTAYPYHDWNERISAECYAPNAASRILDSDKRIVNIVNNYEKISFNFGPTLLSWLEWHKPDVYQEILGADRESQKRFSGHGCAIAQIYNHIIMPLANTRDKRTQVIWGIRDFVFRFQRRPEGMWLPETAVDPETLDILAQQGIAFTVLAPHQARRTRKAGDRIWADVSDGSIDCSMPYLCRLPSGRTIILFFYKEDVTHDVAFSNLLENGDVFAKRMIKNFPSPENRSRLLCIATDGETYGHHHRFGDMALAYALYLIESENLAKISIFGEYLENNPPAHEVEIIKNSSWSCPHGVERWKSDCGCCTHGSVILAGPGTGQSRSQKDSTVSPACPVGWQQKWRAPLREAMDWLRDNLASLYENKMRSSVSDPWLARDDYINVILNRSAENIESFFSKHAVRMLSGEEKIRVLKLLEMQRNALLMFTSCGWFFDEISGIEAVQVMKYACRAMQLAREVSGTDPEPEFMGILRNAPSNIPEYGNGAKIYQDLVKSAAIDLSRVGFHYALSSLAVDSPEMVQIKNYTIRSEAYERADAGALKLATGRAFLRSDITWEENTIFFAVLHLGNHNFMGGASIHTDDRVFAQMQAEFREAFSKTDIPELVLLLNRYFGDHSYSLWHLLRDGQRKVLYYVLDATLTDLESSFRQIYRQYFPLLLAMKEMRVTPPEALEVPVQYILNVDLKKNLGNSEIDPRRISVLVDEMVKGHFNPDTETLSYIACTAITGLMHKLTINPEDVDLMGRINAIFSILSPLGLKYNLWECQNSYFLIGKEKMAIMREKAKRKEAYAMQWLGKFEELGKFLGVKSP